MPNIEIHGYTEPTVPQMLRKQIFEELFADKSYSKEMVVTIVPSEVTDKDNRQQPFLRVLSSDAQEAEEILGVLAEKLPGLDLEYVKIEKFIPKKPGG